MPRVDVILPAVFTAFGVAVLWQSLTQMGYYNAERGAPGPGFVPFWVSLGVVGLGVAAIVRALLRHETLAADQQWPDRQGWKRIGQLLAGFVLLLATVNVLGFVVATIVFLVAMMYVLGQRSLAVLVPVSVGMGLAVHLIFNVALRISLPVGLLGDYLQEAFAWTS